MKDDERIIMKCPADNTELTMGERAGMEIDYCPQCRGIWLERGKIDKIIERSIPKQMEEQRYYDPRERKRGFWERFDMD